MRLLVSYETHTRVKRPCGSTDDVGVMRGRVAHLFFVLFFCSVLFSFFVTVGLGAHCIQFSSLSVHRIAESS